MRERSTDKNIKENIFILKVFTLRKSQIAQIQETAGIEKKKNTVKLPRLPLVSSEWKMSNFLWRLSHLRGSSCISSKFEG